MNLQLLVEHDHTGLVTQPGAELQLFQPALLRRLFDGGVDFGTFFCKTTD